MTTLDHLHELFALLCDPKRHTKCAMARDERGDGVEWDHKSAVSWCLLGAIHKVTSGGPEGLAIVDALRAARPAYLSHYPLHEFNDCYFDQVLPLIERAIEREAVDA